MKVKTLSIVVGGRKCNAKCPFCVSKLTGKGCSDEDNTINLRNFKKTCELAKQSGVSNVILTGKGEPLLYPDLITKYLELLESYNFPFIELQTNGIALDNIDGHTLQKWYDFGLTTVSLSCVDAHASDSRDIYGENYRGIHAYAKTLNNFGFLVRASCIMINTKINCVDRVVNLAEQCKEWGIEQLTVRPVTNISWDEVISSPDEEYSQKLAVYEWIEEYKLDPKIPFEIMEFLDYHGNILLELPHGAKVYDYEGQNICITNCLTNSSNPDSIRQLIFYGNGRLKYSWTNKGAILL